MNVTNNCGSTIEANDNILVVACPYANNNTGILQLFNDETGELITTIEGKEENAMLGLQVVIRDIPDTYHAVYYVSHITSSTFT